MIRLTQYGGAAMKRQLASILSVWLTLALPSGAAAQQPTASAQQQAEDKFKAGRALIERDVEGALTLFKESLALQKTAGTLLNLAFCEEKLGLVASASQHYEEALPLLTKTDKRVQFANERIEAIGPRIPTLRIHLDEQAPSGAGVFLGDRKADDALDTDIRLDPGTYVITAGAPGHVAKRYEVTLTEGQKETLVVSPALAISSPPPAASGPAPSSIGVAPAVTSTLRAAPSPPAPQPRPAPPSSLLRPAAFVTLGVASAAIIGGVVTGGLALVRRQELGAKCPGKQDCDPALKSLQADGITFGNASTAMFAMAATMAAAGAVMLVVASRSRSSKPTVGLGVSAGAISIHGQF